MFCKKNYLAVALLSTLSASALLYAQEENSPMPAAPMPRMPMPAAPMPDMQNPMPDMPNPMLEMPNPEADPMPEPQPQRAPAEICAELKILSVCTNNLKANCIKTNTLKANSACTKTLQADTGCIGSLQVTDLCSQRTNLQNICTNQLNTANLCAQNAQLTAACINQQSTGKICANSISTQDLCVKGNLRNCSLFSARAALSVDTPYILGDVVPFDQILSDPSSLIAQGPTRFIAPESGTYIATAQVNQKDLTGTSIIAGTPVGSLEIYVGGILRRQVFLPYLTFNKNQSSLSTSLIFLQKGEELLVRYNVFVLDQVAGLTPYVGQVTLIGNPGASFRSFLSVHYLSSDCDTLDCPTCDISCLQCTPCTPSVTCQPCGTPCVDCNNSCEPCVPVV